MIFTYKLSISSPIDPGNPTVKVINLTVGVLKNVEVMFPAGCEGDVGVRIKERERIIFPSSEDEWLIDDDRVIRWSENYIILPRHARFKLEGYNIDPIFDHCVYFRFNIIEIVSSYISSSSDIDAIAAEMM